jgi:hypothetical protein
MDIRRRGRRARGGVNVDVDQMHFQGCADDATGKVTSPNKYDMAEEQRRFLHSIEKTRVSVVIYGAGPRETRRYEALAHRVISARNAPRGAVLFFYHVVLTVTASSWEYFVRLQISSQRTSCQRGSCEH